MFHKTGKEETTQELKKAWNNPSPAPKEPKKPKRTLTYNGPCNGALGITTIMA